MVQCNHSSENIIGLDTVQRWNLRIFLTSVTIALVRHYEGNKFVLVATKEEVMSSLSLFS